MGRSRPVRGHWDLPGTVMKPPHWRPSDFPTDGHQISPGGVGLSTTSFGELGDGDGLLAARADCPQPRRPHEAVALRTPLISERPGAAVVTDIDAERPAAPGRRKRWRRNLGPVAPSPSRNPTARRTPALTPHCHKGPPTSPAGRYAIVPRRSFSGHGGHPSGGCCPQSPQ